MPVWGLFRPPPRAVEGIRPPLHRRIYQRARDWLHQRPHYWLRRAAGGSTRGPATGSTRGPTAGPGGGAGGGGSGGRQLQPCKDRIRAAKPVMILAIDMCSIGSKRRGRNISTPLDNGIPPLPPPAHLQAV